MKKDVTVFTPQVLDLWNYDQSVKKVKGFVFKWKNLNEDIRQELRIAREALSQKRCKRNISQTWTSYCQDIGADRSTVHRWLALPAHVAHATGENEWDTPPEFIEAARIAMKSIDTDPATNEEANDRIGASLFYTIDMDGRDKPWRGNVWLNPPYAQPLIAEFSEAVVAKFNAHEFHQACVLVNNATETEWFQNMLAACSCVCFIHGRVKFIDKSGKPSGAPLQGQAILYLGPNPQSFTKVFAKFGPVLWREKQ